MALSGTNKTKQGSFINEELLVPKRVVDIILDINHPQAKEFGGYDAIGTIFYTDPYDYAGEEETFNKEFARPLFSFMKQYPLRGEIILILNSLSKDFYFVDNSQTTYYLPNVNIWNHPHHNALPDHPYTGGEDVEDLLDKYKMVDGGVKRTPSDGSTDVELGEYFNEKLNIQPLLPFEGDTIIEGRFGNSIRLGATAKEAKEKTAYSTKGETGDPITIIRNGQYIEEDRDRGWEHTIENINTDDSSVILTSNQVFPNFQIVSQHYQSWQTEYDFLDVNEANDDFDNITLGSAPEKIEIPEEEEIEYAGEDLEDDNDKEEEPKWVKHVSMWNGEINYINAEIATETDTGGYYFDPEKEKEKDVSYRTKDAYEAAQSQSEDINNLEGREEEILEEEGSIYDLLLEQDNFSESDFSWSVQDEWSANADPEKENDLYSKEEVESENVDPINTQEEEEGDDSEDDNENDTDIDVDDTDPDADDDTDVSGSEDNTQTSESIAVNVTGSGLLASSPTPEAVKDSYYSSDTDVPDNYFDNLVTPSLNGTKGWVEGTSRRKAQFKKENYGGKNWAGRKPEADPNNTGWRVAYNYRGAKFLIPKPAPLSIAIQKWRVDLGSSKTVKWNDKRTVVDGKNLKKRASLYKGDPETVSIKYLCIHTTAGEPVIDGLDGCNFHLYRSCWPAYGYNWLIGIRGDVVQTMPDYVMGVGIGAGSKGIGSFIAKDGNRYYGGDWSNPTNPGYDPKALSAWGETTHANNNNTIQINWSGGAERYSGNDATDTVNKGKDDEYKEYVYGVHDVSKGMGIIDKEENWKSLGSGRFSHTVGYGTVTDKQLIAIKELIYIYIKRYPDIKFFGHNQVTAKACPWWWTPTFLEYVLDAPDPNNPLHSHPDDFHDRDYYIVKGGRKNTSTGFYLENAKDAGLRATGKKGIEKTTGWKKHGLTAANIGKKTKSNY